MGMITQYRGLFRVKNVKEDGKKTEPWHCELTKKISAYLGVIVRAFGGTGQLGHGTIYYLSEKDLLKLFKKIPKQKFIGGRRTFIMVPPYGILSPPTKWVHLYIEKISQAEANASTASETGEQQVVVHKLKMIKLRKGGFDIADDVFASTKNWKGLCLELEYKNKTKACAIQLTKQECEELFGETYSKELAQSPAYFKITLSRKKIKELQPK